jgi:tetratricopeptide (TPR) repeat protein
MRRTSGVQALLFLLVWLAWAAVSEADGLERRARLDRAIEDYSAALEESDRDARLAGFARAQQGFASLVEDGVETSALWTNLGNAALQAGRPGEAMLAYRRALRLDPTATAASQNVEHLRSRLPGWVPRPEGGTGPRALLVSAGLDAGRRAWMTAVCFVVAAGCVVLAGRRTEGAWRGLAMVAGVGWAVGLASLFYAAEAGDADLAVITAEEAEARAADSSLAPLALPDPLPGGVEVRALETRGEWTRVRLANGRDVWLRASVVTRVAD